MPDIMDRTEARINALPVPWRWLVDALFRIVCLALVIGGSIGLIVIIALVGQRFTAVFGIGAGLLFLFVVLVLPNLKD